MNKTIRICARCKSRIKVGRMKVGRVVWPKGQCYDCYRKYHSKKFK